MKYFIFIKPGGELFQLFVELYPFFPWFQCKHFREGKFNLRQTVSITENLDTKFCSALSRDAEFAELNIRGKVLLQMTSISKKHYCSVQLSQFCVHFTKQNYSENNRMQTSSLNLRLLILTVTYFILFSLFLKIPYNYIKKIYPHPEFRLMIKIQKEGTTEQKQHCFTCALSHSYFQADIV